MSITIHSSFLPHTDHRHARPVAFRQFMEQLRAIRAHLTQGPKSDELLFGVSLLGQRLDEATDDGEDRI